MVNENLKLFNDFQDIHDKYMQDPIKWQTQFNFLGKTIVNIIRIWERKLCQDSERGQFGKFSDTLADKFWNVVRMDYPKIDFVGVEIK